MSDDLLQGGQLSLSNWRNILGLQEGREYTFSEVRSRNYIGVQSVFIVDGIKSLFFKTLFLREKFCGRVRGG